MADADSILASLEDVHHAVLAISLTANACQGNDSRQGDGLQVDLAFGVAFMADCAIERVEAVKALVRGMRDAC